jgi:curved DNA-binding protein CbpA
MPRPRTYYDNLKVSRNASPEVIRSAYRRLSQKHHPDRNPDNPEAARVMVLINVAYQALSDPAKRARHDQWIRQQAEPDTQTVWAEPADFTETAREYSPRKPRSSPRRKAGVDHASVTDGLRRVVRGAFVFMVLLLAAIPMLTSLTAFWSAPERASYNVTKSAAIGGEGSRWQVIRAPYVDLAGTYQLVKSDFKQDDGESHRHSKGKLIIQPIHAGSFLVLEAKTIVNVRTFGYAHVFHVLTEASGFGQIELRSAQGERLTRIGNHLVLHTIGLNFEETTWWNKVAGEYSEKYLDRALQQAHENFLSLSRPATYFMTNPQREAGLQPMHTL